jgi:hypothetical protein
MPMPLDERSTSLLRGLSDFWTRFFADTAELEAFFNATEIQLADAYLQILQTFLGISLQDVPLFRRNAFRLLTIREDRIAYRAAFNAGASRYLYTLPEAYSTVPALQNKVFDPTVAFVPGTEYDLDTGAYALQFVQDPTGSVGQTLGFSDAASLLTYGTGELIQCYVTDGTMFTNARPGHWVRLGNSSVGNNGTFRIAQVLDAQNVLLAGTFTLPDPNSGLLRATLLNSEFMAAAGFAKRVLAAETGGSFDDARRRMAEAEQASWAADWPAGMGVRKGDILRVLDPEAVPAAPADYGIALVRHDRFYLATTTPLSTSAGPQLSDAGRICTVNPLTNRILLTAHGLTKGTRILLVTTGTMPGGVTAAQFYYVRDPSVDDFELSATPNGSVVDITSVGSGVLTAYVVGTGTVPRLARSYVVLRTPPDTAIIEESVVFAQTGATALGTTGQLVDGGPGLGPCFTVPPPAAAPFTITDKQRFVTLGGAGVITSVVDISYGNKLQRTGGMAAPFSRSGIGGQVSITSGTQTGTYVILEVVNDNTVVLEGAALTPEAGVAITVETVTNDGTYRIQRLGNETAPGSGLYRSAVLEPTFAYPDANSGSLDWVLHDGYRASLVHTRIVRDSLTLSGAIGSTDTGGMHEPHESEDFAVDYEAGRLVQVGRLAGLWGTNPLPPFIKASYEWLREIVAETDTALATLRSDDNVADVAEVAFWVPDAQIDHFALYQNFGYLIGRFQPSSENYRQFIRGIFQLYMLGPTLKRMESALNVICALPVVRDDGETLMSYEAAGTIIDDPSHARITTQRTTGAQAVYLFPTGTPIRDDIIAYVPGTSTAIVFQAFEPLTQLFQVIDWTTDATWWDSIIVPQALMPGESPMRRTTVSLIYENVVGQTDDPHVGDPGLFVGADEEGHIPAWAPGDSTPAKRRKMVNLVVDKFIKRNLFYVHFDAALAALLPAAFINDLRDLVLIAKPGYTMVYVEPADHFVDVLQMNEQPLTFVGAPTLEDRAPVLCEQPLVIGGQWHVGDNFRRGGALLGQSLLVADGVTVPAPVSLVHGHLTLQRVICPAAPVLEGTDYTVDYVVGTITPLTAWPAGTYTIDYAYWIITLEASADPSLGDTPIMVGGQDLHFGNLGQDYYGNPAAPVLAEQPVQIRVVT